MYTLYPAIRTYATQRIEVTPPHVLHIEECGNPEGPPVLIFHSGPGAGCEQFHRRFFDPELYRIILFDQRGAGRSTPHAELEKNTTQDLINDIEVIREKLNIERWYLFGSAWGSTLALLYAEQFPHCVSGLILSCLFLGRQQDINWFYQKGANAIFPEHWQNFVSQIPKNERDDLITAYARRLNGDDELARMSAAKHWSLWQANCLSLHPHLNIIEHFSDPHFALGLACVETHYFSNNCFIEDDFILKNIHRIRHLPMFLIHGRYDMISPLENAWELHNVCPNSELIVVRDAGHSLKEAGFIDGIILAGKQILDSDSTAC